MSVLVTGNQSGLGKYISREFGASGLDQDLPEEERKRLLARGAEVIVHCAFSAARGVDTDLLGKYYQDNIRLTYEVASCPHKIFIYISSLDVYPKDGKIYSEDDQIPLDDIHGLYPLTKLISESIVRKYCPRHIILRPGALLGKDARPNSLTRIAFEENCALTLSGDSRFNYVLHRDIFDFIVFAIERKVTGVYNVAASESITLGDIARMLGKEVRFGTFHYDVGEFNTQKITSLFPRFRKTSREVIEEFLRSTP